MKKKICIFALCLSIVFSGISNSYLTSKATGFEPLLFSAVPVLGTILLSAGCTYMAYQLISDAIEKSEREEVYRQAILSMNETQNGLGDKIVSDIESSHGSTVVIQKENYSELLQYIAKKPSLEVSHYGDVLTSSSAITNYIMNNESVKFRNKPMNQNFTNTTSATDLINSVVNNLQSKYSSISAYIVRTNLADTVNNALGEQLLFVGGSPGAGYANAKFNSDGSLNTINYIGYNTLNEFRITNAAEQLRIKTSIYSASSNPSVLITHDSAFSVGIIKYSSTTLSTPNGGYVVDCSIPTDANIYFWKPTTASNNLGNVNCYLYQPLIIGNQVVISNNVPIHSVYQAEIEDANFDVVTKDRIITDGVIGGDIAIELPGIGELNDVVNGIQDGTKTIVDAYPLINTIPVDIAKNEALTEAITIPEAIEKVNTQTIVPDIPIIQPSAYVADLRELFPFCLPFDIYKFLSCLDASPEAPSVTINMPIGYEADKNGKYSIIYKEYEIDLSQFDSVAKVVRLMELLLFIVGLATITRQYFAR